MKIRESKDHLLCADNSTSKVIKQECVLPCPFKYIKISLKMFHNLDR